jgi:hypothetical protein
MALDGYRFHIAGEFSGRLNAPSANALAEGIDLFNPRSGLICQALDR